VLDVVQYTHDTRLEILGYVCAAKKLRELDGARARSVGGAAVYKGLALAGVADACGVKQASKSSASARYKSSSLLKSIPTLLSA
jgi:hypothetical protein